MRSFDKPDASGGLRLRDAKTGRASVQDEADRRELARERGQPIAEMVHIAPAGRQDGFRQGVSQTLI